MRLMQRGWLVLSWVAIACLVGVLAVGQAAMAAEASALTPPAFDQARAALSTVEGAAPASSATDEEHFAKGEVQFDNQWVPIDDLFKDYQAARTQLQGLNSQVDATRGRMAEFQHQLNDMKNQSAVQERPIRAEIAKAKAKQREYQKALNARAPTPPQLQPMPPQPAQTNYTNQYGTDPQEQWRRQCDAIRVQNDQLKQQYKQQLDAYKKKQDEAKKEMPKVLASVKQDEDQLKKIADDLSTQQAPSAEKYKAVSDEMGAILRQTTVLETGIQSMAAAMRAAPDTVRFGHGIVEWEGVFYPLADLEKLYTDTQAEINRVNQQMKAEAEAAGRTFPPDWRHPQQDRMDALKVLVDHAKKGQAAK